MSFTNRRNFSARRWRSVAIALSIVGLLAAGTSCSSGPQPPQPGTPAFYWAAARETYRAGDVLKTNENLQRIIATDNEFSARARAWDAVISAGLTQAYIDLADTWEAGARANRNNPTPFRKQVSALRSQASASAIQFTEDIHKLVAVDKDPTILLAFAYPAGTVAQPAGLKRVAGGILVQDSEVGTAARGHVAARRSVERLRRRGQPGRCGSHPGETEDRRIPCAARHIPDGGLPRACRTNRNCSPAPN